MITYKPQQVTNPSTKEKQWYALIKLGSTMYEDELARRISYATSLTESDVKGMLKALQMEVRFAFQSGRTVVMSELGSFIPSLGSKLCDSEDKVDDSTVTEVRVNYRKSGPMRSALLRGKGGVELRRARKSDDGKS